MKRIKFILLTLILGIFGVVACSKQKEIICTGKPSFHYRQNVLLHSVKFGEHHDCAIKKVYMNICPQMYDVICATRIATTKIQVDMYLRMPEQFIEKDPKWNN